MTDKKKPEEKPVNIAYGALYMKKGDKVDKAIAEINRISAKKPYAWFYDIICTPNQVDNARTTIAAIYGQITEKNPEMPESKMVVGITTSEKLRPAATVMQRLSQSVAGEDLVLGMQDYFEQKRMFLWIGGQPQHPPFEEEPNG